MPDLGSIGAGIAGSGAGWISSALFWAKWFFIVVAIGIVMFLFYSLCSTTND